MADDTMNTSPDSSKPVPRSRPTSLPWPGLVVNFAVTVGTGAIALATRRRRGRAARFIRALAAAGAGVIWAYVLAIRPWHLHWGATAEEVRQPMPGDGQVATAHIDATRAVTIAAPPEAVWPWLVQMGQGRAGFYTYAWIENLGGMHIRNADRILPQWQRLAVGDLLPTGPGEGFTVAALEPNRLLHLVIPDPRMHVSVVMMLHPLDEGRTRLVARLRVAFCRTELWPLYELLFDPGDFVLMRGMMRGIKQRAERAAQDRSWRPRNIE